jgi:hypothetical protein
MFAMLSAERPRTPTGSALRFFTALDNNGRSTQNDISYCV